MPQIIPAIVSYGVQAATLSTLGTIGAGIAGAIAGGLVASALAPTQKSQGPRLGDLRIQSSSYGTVIPYVLGSPRIAAQVIWASVIREIATTTESGGKGGGGQENTTYSYEVDLLLLLTDNEQLGVDKCWLNGGLIWNKSAETDNATRVASDNIPQWTSISIYTGDAAQLPDPIYEAAVGTANAPAYRGHLTLMLQSVQLGNSKNIPNFTFRIGEPFGYISDGLTRLQTAFAGASSADVSQYLIGSGTNDEFTVIAGSASALFDSNANPKSLIYSDVGISQISDNAPLTYEILWKATLDTPSPQSPGDVVKFAQFTTHLNGIDFYIRGYPNDTDLLIVQSGYTTVTVTAGHAYGSLNHLALVNRSTGVMDIYVNGVRVVTGRDDGTTLAGLGTMQLGGIGRGDTRVTYYGARVRREEVYPDTGTFTPPTSPVDWGTP